MMEKDVFGELRSRYLFLFVNSKKIKHFIKISYI